MQVYYSGPVQLEGMPHRYYIPLKFTPHLQYHEFFMPPNRTRIILFSTSRYNTILDAPAFRSFHVIRKQRVSYVQFILLEILFLKLS